MLNDAISIYFADVALASAEAPGTNGTRQVLRPTGTKFRGIEGVIDSQRPEYLARNEPRVGVPWAGCGMTKAVQPTADYYREKADEIRRSAQRASSAEVRLELLEIADLFERMADRVERRSRAAAD